MTSKMSDKEIVAKWNKAREATRRNAAKRQVIYQKAVAMGITATDVEVDEYLKKTA